MVAIEIDWNDPGLFMRDKNSSTLPLGPEDPAIEIYKRGINMTRNDAEQILKQSLENLFAKDAILLENDVSERAITHKLAEYLNSHLAALGLKDLQELSVDCEYNRNLENGRFEPKSIQVLTAKRTAELSKQSNLSEEDYRSVTTFPDVIIHHRGYNTRNLLVIEVKKKNNPTGSAFDFQKLEAFTAKTGENHYGYEHGVFILLTTGQKPRMPDFQWFSKGQKEVCPTGTAAAQREGENQSR